MFWGLWGSLRPKPRYLSWQELKQVSTLSFTRSLLAFSDTDTYCGKKLFFPSFSFHKNTVDLAKALPCEFLQVVCVYPCVGPPRPLLKRKDGLAVLNHTASSRSLSRASRLTAHLHLSQLYTRSYGDIMLNINCSSNTQENLTTLFTAERQSKLE